MKKIGITLFAILAMAGVNAHADLVTAQKLADKYAVIAKNIDPAFAGPSAEEGKAFFNRELLIKGKPTACASCHTSNPANEGKHIVTGKPIRPLAPAVNEKRFADIDKVEKNFTKHCNDITGRDCSAKEKTNFITYLISVK
jgi:mono/diheme cytochrome c family protein